MIKSFTNMMLLICLLSSIHANSQDTTKVENSSGKLIEFLSAESYNIKKQDSMDFLILVGHVKVNKALLYYLETVS